MPHLLRGLIDVRVKRAKAMQPITRNSFTDDRVGGRSILARG
jgi:hypothetical protein